MLLPGMKTLFASSGKYDKIGAGAAASRVSFTTLSVEDADSAAAFSNAAANASTSAADASISFSASVLGASAATDALAGVAAANPICVMTLGYEVSKNPQALCGTCNC